MRAHVVTLGFLGALPGLARAEVDPACAGLARPADYDEQVQQDFQQNYFALTSSFSPVHGAVPHAPGRGMLGVSVSIMPPLSCAERFVLDWSKTEDVNKSPVLPRVVGSFSFPAIAKIVVPYAGLGLFPTIPFAGTRNLVISGEIGVGVMAHPFVDVGARFHTSMLRSYGDFATAFDPETQPVVEDVYTGSTWGVDAVVSFPIETGKHQISPFLAVGYLNASTFFFVGDTQVSINNLHPYGSVAFSVGLDTLIAEHFRLGAEFYGAPGGYSVVDPAAPNVDDATRYGRLYTGRLRLGYEFGGARKARGDGTKRPARPSSSGS